MYSIYILYINLNKLYIIICIELTVLNFSPWVQFFNILCDEMGSPVRALGCVTRYLGKHMHNWATNQSSCFSFKLTRSLFLLERTTDEIQLLNLGIWQTSLWSRVKWSFYFRGNRWHYLLLKTKFETWRKNRFFG